MTLGVDALDERSHESEVDDSHDDRENTHPITQNGQLAPGDAGRSPEKRGDSKSREYQGKRDNEHQDITAECSGDQEA
jgi:hypothetical protein